MLAPTPKNPSIEAPTHTSTHPHDPYIHIHIWTLTHTGIYPCNHAPENSSAWKVTSKNLPSGAVNVQKHCMGTRRSPSVALRLTPNLTGCNEYITKYHYTFIKKCRFLGKGIHFIKTRRSQYIFIYLTLTLALTLIGTLSQDVISLTHWGRDEINNISQTTFSNAFSSMKMFEFRLKFHWSLFPRV